MKRSPKTWTLKDLIDFEAFLSKKTALQEWLSTRNPQNPTVLNDQPPQSKLSERERRRNSFRASLESFRQHESHAFLGQKLLNTFFLIEFLLFFSFLLLGGTAIRGLLRPFKYLTFPDSSQQPFWTEARGFPIWVLLVVGVGIPLFFFLLGSLSYWLWRKWSGSLSFLQRILQWMARLFSKQSLSERQWHHLLADPSIAALIKNRLRRMLQTGGIAYQIGLFLGLVACILFLEIDFFWETSLPHLGQLPLESITTFLEAPVQGRILSLQDLSQTRLILDFSEAIKAHQDSSYQPFSVTDRIALRSHWVLFFLFCFSFWGILPRFLLWVFAFFKESRLLANLSFQEQRHRVLWRNLTRIHRKEPQTTQADEVVLLEIGGFELSTETIRPFLLQQLRVHPSGRFTLGQIDQEKEQEALQAVQKASLGVVFLVEGWNLSPKQMIKHHKLIKDTLSKQSSPSYSEQKIRYLVTGTSEEFAQWVNFLDSLKDELSEAYHYIG